jgi:hypothetical protein
VDHVAGAAHDRERAARQLAVQPLRMRGDIDDAVAGPGDDRDGTASSAWRALFALAWPTMNAASSALARSCTGRTSISRESVATYCTGTSWGANMARTMRSSMTRAETAVTV